MPEQTNLPPEELKPEVVVSSIQPFPCSDAFRSSLAKVLGIEGGFTDDPNDSGGATKWGITQETLDRNSAVKMHVGEMDPTTAAKIYHDQYWLPIRADELWAISPKVAYELFDTGVNMGPGIGVRFLQRCLNVLNRQQTDWLDVPVNGRMDQNTLDALWIYFHYRKALAEPVLLKMLNSLQGTRYIELAEQRAKDETFVFGWFNQRVEI